MKITFHTFIEKQNVAANMLLEPIRNRFSPVQIKNMDISLHVLLQTARNCSHLLPAAIRVSAQ
jgi:hypothetical protein